MASVVILIPARFASTRFPGKPLALIRGKTMIERVYTNCLCSGFDTAVVTDHDGIEAKVKSFGGKVVRVDDDVPSGSERIALAHERFFPDASFIINVQGDEPLLKGELLKELADFHLKSHFDVTTLVRERHSRETDFHNPNVVKAVFTARQQCLYFSRSPVPFDREGKTDYSWFHHIGVYSYKSHALKAFVRLPVSTLEDIEKLEQLRALENGLSIGAIKTKEILVGVDVPEDIKKVEGVLGE